MYYLIEMLLDGKRLGYLTRAGNVVDYYQAAVLDNPYECLEAIRRARQYTRGARFVARDIELARP